MGKFFDEYEDDTPQEDNKFETGGAFLTAGEKDLLIREEVGFPILAVRSGETKHGLRWYVDTEIEGEPRTIGFGKGGKVVSRDKQLAAIQAWLKEGKQPPVVKIVKDGMSHVLKDAE